MRTKALATVTAGLMFLAPGLSRPAEARDWSAGANFSVGPIAFSLVFGAHGRYRPGYYWRTTEGLSYRGLRCSERCFTERKRHFHHDSCPLLHHHLRIHRSSAADLFHGHAPRPYWEGRHYKSSSPYGERSWRERRHRHHDDSWRSERHHDRPHRHHSSCDHGRRYRP